MTAGTAIADTATRFEETKEALHDMQALLLLLQKWPLNPDLLVHCVEYVEPELGLSDAKAQLLFANQPFVGGTVEALSSVVDIDLIAALHLCVFARRFLPVRRLLDADS